MPYMSDTNGSCARCGNEEDDAGFCQLCQEAIIIEDAIKTGEWNELEKEGKSMVEEGGKNE